MNFAAPSRPVRSHSVLWSDLLWQQRNILALDDESLGRKQPCSEPHSTDEYGTSSFTYERLRWVTACTPSSSHATEKNDCALPSSTTAFSQRSLSSSFRVNSLTFSSLLLFTLIYTFISPSVAYSIMCSHRSINHASDTCPPSGDFRSGTLQIDSQTFPRCHYYPVLVPDTLPLLSLS